MNRDKFIEYIPIFKYLLLILTRYSFNMRLYVGKQNYVKNIYKFYCLLKFRLVVTSVL